MHVDCVLCHTCMSVHQTQSKKFQLLCAVLEISWPEGSKILNRKQFKADNYEYHMQRIAPTCALIVNCVLKKYQLGCIDNQFCAEKVPTLTPCLSGADSELAKYQAQWIDHYSALACLGNKIAKRQVAMGNLSAP